MKIRKVSMASWKKLRISRLSFQTTGMGRIKIMMSKAILRALLVAWML